MPGKEIESGVQSEGDDAHELNNFAGESRAPESPKGSRVTTVSLAVVNNKKAPYALKFFHDISPDIDPIKKLIERAIDGVLACHKNMIPETGEKFKTRYSEVKTIRDFVHLIMDDIYDLGQHCLEHQDLELDTVNHQFYWYEVIESLISKVYYEYRGIQMNNKIKAAENLDIKTIAAQKAGSNPKTIEEDLIYEIAQLNFYKSKLKEAKYAWGDKKGEQVRFAEYTNYLIQLKERVIHPKVREYRRRNAVVQQPRSIPMLRA